MKSFEELRIQETVSPTIDDLFKLNESAFDSLNESQKIEVQELIDKLGDKKISELDEGILSSIFGGVAGFLIGPSIGRVIANCLGINAGILYDMLTSRLVSAALGAAVTNYVTSTKK